MLSGLPNIFRTDEDEGRTYEHPQSMKPPLPPQVAPSTPTGGNGINVSFSESADTYGSASVGRKDSITASMVDQTHSPAHHVNFKPLSDPSEVDVPDELSPLIVEHITPPRAFVTDLTPSIKTSNEKVFRVILPNNAGGGESSQNTPGDASAGSIPTFFGTPSAIFVPDEQPSSCGRCLCSLWQDMKNFHGHEGSIPQSLTIGLCIAVVCGVAAFLYYTVLFALLEYIWHTLPNKYVVNHWSPEWTYILWMPLVILPMGLGVGLSVRLLGEPGDLAYTIQCVHQKAYIELDHVLPMVMASQFSIVGGGSLGPEAPLVAICAALAGFISRHVFAQRNRNIIRKHTLMGMAGALAAFFGAPLGGSVFALEVCSRFGIEYFEHLIEAVLVGVMTLAVFRFLANLPMEAMWSISPDKLTSVRVGDLAVGAFFGFLASLAGMLFTYCHWCLMSMLDRLGLLDNRRAIQRAMIGAIFISVIGMFIPHTLFWGELEIQQIATGAPSKNLPHVFPTTGVVGFEMDSALNAFLVGVAKLVTISFTVAGGYRGGFIFPLFSAGAAFGRAFVYFFPSVSLSLACLSFAAGVNVAITKTSLATPLILTFLSGEESALPVVLTASLVSLFATSYMPFIKTQVNREDIDQSLIPRYPPVINDEEASILSSLSRRTRAKRTTLLYDEPDDSELVPYTNSSIHRASFLSDHSFIGRFDRSESLCLRVTPSTHRAESIGVSSVVDPSEIAESMRSISHRTNEPSLRSITQRSFIV